MDIEKQIEQMAKTIAIKEIVKALECCGISGTYVCDEKCPMFDNEIKGMSDCKRALNLSAAKLINRQQAEIERLQTALFKQEETMQIIAKEKQQYFDELQTAKAEAVREFADRLKEKCHNYYPSIDSYCVSRKAVAVMDIENLVKEMAGDTE